MSPKQRKKETTSPEGVRTKTQKFKEGISMGQEWKLSHSHYYQTAVVLVHIRQLVQIWFGRLWKTNGSATFFFVMLFLCFFTCGCL